MNSEASVTMKDGSRVRMTSWPLMRAEDAGDDEASPGWRASSGQADDQDQAGEDQAGEGDHRADREIELAADHQQRRGDGEDAELRGRRQDGHDARQREHRRVGGGEEEDDDQDQAGNGAELGPAHGLGQRRCLRQPLVAPGRCVGVVGSRGSLASSAG